ncbi:MAG: peptidoglycan DD-metalloendopeptidase family protein [Spirochaetes bacterium]|nr:peptidoglycan DD-metalloendopeptidase family protein [Spirochaetota bacterium]
MFTPLKMKAAVYLMIFGIVMTAFPLILHAKYYTVVKGDTIYGISRKTGADVKEIIRLNDLSDPKKLYVGKKIKLPDSSEKSASDKKPAVKSAVNFNWPVKYVRHIEKDGESGVKSIGIYIISTKGAYVATSASGNVSKIGYIRGYGNYIVITHSSRYMTVYSNLDFIYVKSGQNVSSGKVIGRLSEKKDRFHFQINQAGKPQDVLKILPKP